MSPNTTKFVSGRLKEARDARGIPTLITLASLLNVNTSSVSRWEDGQSVPSGEKLLDLAEKLNLRPSYFLRPMFNHGDGPVFFRSLASARKRDIGRQRARLRWLQEISIVIQHYIDLPELDTPDLLHGESYQTLRDEDIERIAEELRIYWKLGSDPVANVVDLIERHGFFVGADEMGTTALDGLCNWSSFNSRPYIMLAKDKMSFFRRQMDAAHEMSHAILHKGVSDEALKQDFDLIEAQAFRLASAFLMPAKAFALAVRVPTLSRLMVLKDHWHVSIKAMIRRCKDLALVSPEEERQLYKYYSAKGWSKEEPLDRTVPVASPRMLGQALGLIVSSGIRTKEELLANEFTVKAHDVESLLCLDDGWFSKKTGQLFNFEWTEGRKRGEQFEPGEVVSFAQMIPRRKAD